ncbi:hypothetical protein [Lacticaseibacillus paracasei]|uniref:hypothetical protein n=1 Tax=Lacticaseibacillus paracasei TaxID=1597 RepID=UPI000F0B618F|nr:hypothetical protein [Lacticaseibacillus paracasei]RNE16604.1 hypothetical protein FAM3257_03134 [Lacticaseibacillus paracasei]TLQ33654.1 hypothetical protein FEZ40_16370 [Lacticaseibacillus paracasei]
MTTYTSIIKPLNSSFIGTAAHGKATFTISADVLHIEIEMFDTPKNMQHWEHFHGFPHGENAEPATMAQDTNHDGVVDLPETEAVSGTTMVPFDAQPHKMNIPNDSYPVSNDQGHFKYEKDVPLTDLKAQFKEVFGTDNLELDKRVIYVHGVPSTTKLPATTGGKLTEKYDQHVTLPIAVGKIIKAD